MWLLVIYCVQVWATYTADRCENWSCTAYRFESHTADRCENWSYTVYRFESHILQIDVRTDHVLRIGLSHIYYWSRWVLIIYCISVWVTYTADRNGYWPYTVYRFETHTLQIDASTDRVLCISLRHVYCGMVWGLNVCCRSSGGQNIEATVRCEADKCEKWSYTVDQFESSAYSTVPCQTRVYIVRVRQRVSQTAFGSWSTVVQLATVVSEK